MKKSVRLAEDEVGIGTCVGLLCISSMSGHRHVGHEHGFWGNNMVGLLLGWCLMLGDPRKCCH